MIANDVLCVAAWTNFGEADLIVELPDFQAIVEKHDTACHKLRFST